MNILSWSCDCVFQIASFFALSDATSYVLHLHDDALRFFVAG